MHCTRTPTDGAARAGFTLVELMVVVAIIALAAQVVMVNLGAFIPASVLNAEAGRIIGDVEFVRSEARLQGKAYSIDLDLDNERWRIVLPPEERLVSDQTIEESRPLGWQDLDERVQLVGHRVQGAPTLRSGRSSVKIDKNGFTADQLIHLQMKSEALEDMVWSIRLFGLNRRSRLLTNQDGTEPRLEITEEHEFR